MNGHVIQIGEDRILINRSEKNERGKPSWEVVMFELKTRSDKMETYELKRSQKAPFFIKGFALNRSEIVLLFRNKFYIYDVEKNKKNVILNLNNDEILDFLYFKGNIIYIKKDCMSIFRATVTGKKNLLLSLKVQPTNMSLCVQQNILAISANDRLYFMKIMAFKDKTVLIRNTNVSIPYKNKKTKYVYNSHKNMFYKNKKDYKEVIHVCSYLSNNVVLCKCLKMGETNLNKKVFSKFSVEEFQGSEIKGAFFFEVNETAMEKMGGCVISKNEEQVEKANTMELVKTEKENNNISNSIDGVIPNILEVEKEEKKTQIAEDESIAEVTNDGRSEEGNFRMTNTNRDSSDMPILNEKMEDESWKKESELQGEVINNNIHSSQYVGNEKVNIKMESTCEYTTLGKDTYNNYVKKEIEKENVKDNEKKETMVDTSKLYLSLCSKHGKMLIYYIGPLDSAHIESGFTKFEKKPLVSFQMSNNVLDVQDATVILRKRAIKQLNIIKKKKKK